MNKISERKECIDYLLSRQETFASFHIRDEFIVRDKYPKKYKDVLSSKLTDAFFIENKNQNKILDITTIIIVIMFAMLGAGLTNGIKILGLNPNLFILVGVYLALLSFIIPASNNICKNYLFGKLDLYKYCDFMNDNLFKDNSYKLRTFENAINDLIYMNERLGIKECSKFIGDRNEIICWKTYKHYKKIEKSTDVKDINIKKEYDKNCKKISPSQSITLSAIMLAISCFIEAITIWTTWESIQENKIQFVFCVISFLFFAFGLTWFLTESRVYNSIGTLDSLINIQGRMKLRMPYSIDDNDIANNKIMIKNFKGTNNEFEYFKSKIAKLIRIESKLDVTSRDIYCSNGNIVIICTNIKNNDSNLLKLLNDASYETLIETLFKEYKY